eukprot:gene21225-28138_t
MAGLQQRVQDMEQQEMEWQSAYDGKKARADEAQSDTAATREALIAMSSCTARADEAQSDTAATREALIAMSSSNNTLEADLAAVKAELEKSQASLQILGTHCRELEATSAALTAAAEVGSRVAAGGEGTGAKENAQLGVRTWGQLQTLGTTGRKLEATSAGLTAAAEVGSRVAAGGKGTGAKENAQRRSLSGRTSNPIPAAGTSPLSAPPPSLPPGTGERSRRTSEGVEKGGAAATSTTAPPRGSPPTAPGPQQDAAGPRNDASRQSYDMDDVIAILDTLDDARGTRQGNRPPGPGQGALSRDPPNKATPPRGASAGSSGSSAGSNNLELPCVATSPRTSASGHPRPVVCTKARPDERAGAPRSESPVGRKQNNNSRNRRSSPVTHGIASPAFASPAFAPPSFAPRSSSPPLSTLRKARQAPRPRNTMVEATNMDHLEDIQSRAGDALKWTCVVYYADWCRNCRSTMPELLGLGTCDGLSDKVQFVRANIEEGTHAYQMAISRDVHGLPFACVSRPNGEYAVGISAKDVDELKAKLEVIAQNPDAVHGHHDDEELDILN